MKEFLEFWKQYLHQHKHYTLSLNSFAPIQIPFTKGNIIFINTTYTLQEIIA